MTDRDTTTITITVELGGSEYVHSTEGTHWARDDDGRLYVYDGDMTLLEIKAEHVVEVAREERIDTKPVAADTSTDTTATNTTDTSDTCQ